MNSGLICSVCKDAQSINGLDSFDAIVTDHTDSGVAVSSVWPAPVNHKMAEILVLWKSQLQLQMQTKIRNLQIR